MRASPLLPSLKRQRGAAAVEFALIGGLLIALIYAIFEFSRMLFVYSSMQEITRRGAREATVRWVDQTSTIKRLALFGSTTLPGGPEVTDANIFIRYLQANGIDEVTTTPLDAGDNLAACIDATRTTECIMYVEVSVQNVVYTPVIFKPGKMSVSKIATTLPRATTTVYAESMGFAN
ncbi:TadE/TadG family type IV pilus assembly protein [Pseudoduganella sp. OTU4001]|uniref:TadE/TadG family type IV pilus assembly protein n=1 Tax=Pseudoduganella sp. OTU4001 TaxID=3043854 RepID=UPI00313AAB98